MPSSSVPVVLASVPPKKTVVGVPGRVVGEAGCAEPARTMDQIIAQKVQDRAFAEQRGEGFERGAPRDM